MKITQRVKYAPKTTFWVNFVCGILFNIFAIMPCLASKYSNSDMEDSKWNGCILGTSISIIIIGAIHCFRRSTIWGIVFLSIIILVPLIIFIAMLIYINYSATSNWTKAEKKLYRANIKLKKFSKLVRFNKKNMRVKLQDDNFLKEKISKIYKYFKIDKSEISILHFKTSLQNNALSIVLPQVPQVQDSFHNKCKILGFVEVKDSILSYHVYEKEIYIYEKNFIFFHDIKMNSHDDFRAYLENRKHILIFGIIKNPVFGYSFFN